MPVNSATYTQCTMRTHSLTHMHTVMHAEACMCIHMHVRAHICTQMCARTYTHLHTSAHVFCTYAPVCTHMRILLHIYVCTAYTHVHMQTRALNGILGQILAFLAHLPFGSLIRRVPPEGPPSLCGRWRCPPHTPFSLLFLAVFSLTPFP